MFNKKTWKDRESQYPRRRLLTPVEEGDAALYTVSRAEGTVTEEGDAFSAENMNDLETRIKSECDSIRSALATQQASIGTVATSVTTTNNRVTALANSTNNAINSLTRDMQTTQAMVNEGFGKRAKSKFISFTNFAMSGGVTEGLTVDCSDVLDSRVWGLTVTPEGGSNLFGAILTNATPSTATFTIKCITDPSFTGTITRLDVLVWGY